MQVAQHMDSNTGNLVTSHAKVSLTEGNGDGSNLAMQRTASGSQATLKAVFSQLARDKRGVRGGGGWVGGWVWVGARACV